MSAVVSLLALEHDAALQEHLRTAQSTVYVPQALVSLVPVDAQSRIVADAAKRAVAIQTELVSRDWSREAGRLRSDRSKIEEMLVSNLNERLREHMLLVAGLDAAHERDRIELVLLSDDSSAPAKTAAAWAKSRGVPSVMVSKGRRARSIGISECDYAAACGSREAKAYSESGVATGNVVTTGNPAWDVYSNAVRARSEIRAEFSKSHAVSERDHLVLFVEDEDGSEGSLRAVLRAARELRDLGVPLKLAIEQYSPYPERDERRRKIICEESGGHEPIAVCDSHERWVVASDALISSDSGALTESMIAGTIPIHLWTADACLRGPMYDAQDGVLEAYGETLAIALARSLGDGALRSDLRANAQTRLAEFAVHIGSATSRVADLFARARHAQEGVKTPRFVWQELSDPRSVTEKGVDSIYYRNARTDMIARIRKAPKLMLDVGCGAGATGAEIKKRYPNATVIGIELNPEAAAMANGRIDRIIVDNVETLDFSAAGFADGSIDLVFFPDVLEHLYDPWKLLVRLKPFLAPNAQVIASIPNVRNLWLLTQLIAGSWDYAEEGLLDVTHIRFFTKKTIVQLFEQTGYKVGAIYANGDGRVPDMQAPAGKTVNIDMPQVMLKNMGQEDLIELRTLQFVIDARPLS